MLDNEYDSQALHGPYEVADIGDLVLEEGMTLRGCKLAYATFGRLSAARDNAILVTTWFSGTSKIMEQAYIGPGRALDPDRYLIVVVNQIGGGLSVRRTTRRRRWGWVISRIYASAMTCVRSASY